MRACTGPDPTAERTPPHPPHPLKPSPGHAAPALTAWTTHYPPSTRLQLNPSAIHHRQHIVTRPPPLAGCSVLLAFRRLPSKQKRDKRDANPSRPSAVSPPLPASHPPPLGANLAAPKRLSLCVWLTHFSRRYIHHRSSLLLSFFVPTSNICTISRNPSSLPPTPLSIVQRLVDSTSPELTHPSRPVPAHPPRPPYNQSYIPTPASSALL